MAPFGLTFDEGTAVMYIYTLAVMITGVFIFQSLPAALAGGSTSRLTAIAIAAVLSAFWTLYCEWTILERLPGYTDPQGDTPTE